MGSSRFGHDTSDSEKATLKRKGVASFVISSLHMYVPSSDEIDNV